jgi:hypothetical protein
MKNPIMWMDIAKDELKGSGVNNSKKTQTCSIYDSTNA